MKDKKVPWWELVDFREPDPTTPFSVRVLLMVLNNHIARRSLDGIRLDLADLGDYSLGLANDAIESKGLEQLGFAKAPQEVVARQQAARRTRLS